MTAFGIRHPLIALVGALALGLAGAWAWRHLPVDALPDLSDNQVIVWAEWAGQSPQDVDQQVTSRLSRELQGLAGVRTVRGLSLYGAGYVYVIFDDRRDLYECRTRVLERLAQLGGLLPVGVTARLGPDATAMGQVFAFVLQGPADVERKRRVLDQLVAPALRGVPGVAEVAPAGGVVQEYQIDVDPTRLEEQGLTLDMLMMAVRAAGRDVGAMSVEQSGVETMIRAVGFVRSVADVENIVVRGNRTLGAGVRLGEVALVTRGGQFRQGLLADEAGEQVGAIVALRVGEDPRSAILAVKRKLADLETALRRETLTVAPFYDRLRLIEETSATVSRTLVEAVVTTVIVVVAFLIHVRGSLAVAVSLPLGMLFTFLVMRAAGLGANLMSLAGIAIAVGVMVDFGIIMTENITQHLLDLQARCRREGRPMPVSPFSAEVTDAVVDGAREVTRPLLTSAATTVVGFLPIFALTDQAGRLFAPLALTKTLAISGAVLSGILVVPVLSRLLLPPWQLRRTWLAAFGGLAGGAVAGWFWRDGVSLPMDHGRWALQIPGWLFGPMLAGVLVAAIWRAGREQLVAYEENPASRLIHGTYDWAYTRIQRHRVVFTLTLIALAGTGYLLGLGWRRVSAPLRSVIGWAGGDLANASLDASLSRMFPGMGSSFLPPLDEGSLLFMPSLPATAGLGETQRILMEQNRRIASVPEVAGLMGKLGRAETALDPAPIGMIETVVALKPYVEWPVHEIAQPDGSTVRRPRTWAEVRDALAAITDIPGVAPSWLQPIETRVVMLSTGIRSLIALQVAGDDGDALERFAEAAETIIRGTPGAVDVQMQREGGKPYAEIRLDPARLARFGLSREKVVESIELALGGMPITYSVEGALRYPVRIRYLRERRDDPDEIGQVQVPAASGHGAIPLSSLLAAPLVHTLEFGPEDGAEASGRFLRRLPLAQQRNVTMLSAHAAELTLAAGDELPPWVRAEVTAGRITLRGVRPAESGVTYTVGPMAIRSEQGRRIQYVLLNVRDRGEVEVVRAAEARLRSALERGELQVPAGASYHWVGRYEQKIKADRTLAWIMAASLAAMVVLIYVGTRSWLVTGVIVLCNATVTTAGGFFFVWLWGAQMTTAVAVGFLVLLGVMFNDGILLGTYLQEQFRTPPDSAEEVRRRVFQAGLRRRRPALMTNATTLLSLVPVLWAAGRGAEIMQPMVLPVVGGMLFDLVSLFSVPVFFSWYWERRVGRPPPMSRIT